MEKDKQKKTVLLQYLKNLATNLKIILNYQNVYVGRLLIAKIL